VQALPAGTQTATQTPSSQVWLTLWKDGSAAAASTLTALSLLAAGGYSVWLYRNRFPRAKVTHHVFDWSGCDRHMLRGVVRIENIGKVLIQVRCIRGVLTQVLPTPSDVEVAVKAGKDPVDRDSTEVVWDTLGDRLKDFSKEGCEIEPGEADEFIFDFVIAPNVKKVQFYSHIENIKKFKRNVGWNTTILYDLSDGKESGHVVVQDRAGSSQAGEGSASSATEESGRHKMTETRQGQQKVVKVIVEKQGTPKVVKPQKSDGGGKKA
jgi:hypothetical protein